MENTTQACQKILVKGFDGILLYEFDMDVSETTGFDTPSNPDLERTTWTSSAYLLAPLPLRGVEGLPYCTMRMCHMRGLRNRLTKELVLQPTLPTKQVQENLSTTLEYWKSSEAYTELKSVLTSNWSSLKVNKIATFGLGSPSIGGKDTADATKDTPRDRSRARSLYQHSLIIALHMLISGLSNHGDIKCLAQEPKYTDVDKEVLQEFGVTIVDDPYGFLEADETTAIVSIAPHAPIKEIVTELAHPAVMIWNKSQKDPSPVYTDPETPRVKELIRSSYHTVQSTADLEHFGDLLVHMRKTKLPLKGKL
ncbi:hypothetical protein FQN57_005250 [Myotisia sp. PD_48]|nr:hypothetical protein FQN57_005250 [Myotisia sp. PD_48]